MGDQSTIVTLEWIALFEGTVVPIREHPPAPNRPLIGTKDWAAEALAEVAAMKAQNFAKELEALEKRNRK